MANKIKKAQVVLVAHNATSQDFEFLLLQTNEKRGSFWQNVTGKIENDETFQAGALREAVEETGLKSADIIDIINLEMPFEFTDGRKRKVHEETFLIILKDQWEVLIDPHEHQSWKWAGPEDLQTGIVKFESNLQALEKAREVLKSWRS